MHGLAFDRSKRGFVFRVTVNMGKKVVGKRLKFRFPTADPEAARLMAAGALTVLRVTGLEVIQRPQGRDEDPPPILLLPAPREESHSEDSIPPIDEIS